MGLRTQDTLWVGWAALRSPGARNRDGPLFFADSLSGVTEAGIEGRQVDLAKQPGHDLSRDISKGEAVEHEINSMITRRYNARVASEGEGESGSKRRPLWRPPAKRRPAGASMRAGGGWRCTSTWSHLVNVYRGRMEHHADIVDEMEGRQATNQERKAS